MIYILDYDNWLSADISQLLMNSGLRVTLKNNLATKYPMQALRAILRLFFRRPYFYSYERLVEFFVLDLYFSLVVLIARPKVVIFFKSQTLISLWCCRAIGAHPVIVFGSEPITKNTLSSMSCPRIWSLIDSVELSRSAFCICESTYIRKFINRVPCSVTHFFSPDVRLVEGVEDSLCKIKHAANRKLKPGKTIGRKILFVGGVAKGFEIFKEVQSSLSGDDRFEFYYIGSYVESLENAIVLPWMNPEEFQRFMGSMHITLFPTWSDAGPRMLFEAILSGSRIYCSKNCAGPDLNDFGFLTVLQQSATEYVAALENIDHECEMKGEHLALLHNVGSQQSKLVSAIEKLASS